MIHCPCPNCDGLCDEPIVFPEQSKAEQLGPTSVKIPSDLEPLISAGMKRTGKNRHAYLVAAIQFVAKKEKLA